MRVIGLDIHRVFAEAVLLKNGAARRLGRVGMTRDHLTAFAKTLTHDDHVVVEATGPPPPGCLRHPVSGRSPRQG
jgi:transposase